MPKRHQRHPAPPEWVEAKRAPVSGDSPWWRQVAQELLDRPGLVGSQVTIEELTSSLPCYPDGRRPRPRAAARRLRHILEVVARGPNGSLGKGAVYRVVRPAEELIPPEHNLIDDAWLQESVARIVGKK